MAGTSDAQRIEELTHTVAFLTQRLYEVERRLGTWPAAGHTVTPPPPAPTAVPTAGQTLLAAPTVGVRVEPRAWWQVGPLADVGQDRLPVVALAAAGGLALMFGLLFFVWYAVDQGWLAPTLRVVLGGGIGVALMAVAWWLAPRQRSVAGALGGAGLGSWFASWLVARHVHHLVGHTETFVALALGAAACLVIAGHRQLRSMAFLAGLAAYVTPIATGTVERLHELMIYQVVLMGALWGLEATRKWRELVMLAITGTWLLMLAWAGEHLHGGLGGLQMLPWCAAVLGLGSLQALHAAKRGEVLTAGLRYGVGAAFAWVAVTWAAAPDDTWLWVSTGAMALWHFAMIGVMVHKRLPRGLVAVALTFGWLQAFEFGPLAFDDHWIGVWWLLQATVAVTLFARRPAWGPVRLWLAPGLGALIWAVSEGGSYSTTFIVGLLTAAGLVVMGLWPKETVPAQPAEDGMMPQGQRELTWITGLGGFAAWLWVDYVHLGMMFTDKFAPLLFMVPVAAWAVFADLKPTRARLQVAVAAAFAAVVGIAVDAASRGLFDAHVALDGYRTVLVASLLLAVTSVFGHVVALRRRRPSASATHTWAVHDASGITAAAGMAIAATLVWTGAVQGFALTPSAEGSLLQAGWSVALAAVALALVIAGLRLDRASWRKIGIAALFGVAGKVVLVDLGQVDLAWRVVSFLGLGVCLVAGALAYGRFEKRVQQTRQAA